MDLSVVTVHSSRESTTGPYGKVLVMLRRGKESHMDLAYVSFFPAHELCVKLNVI